MSKFELAQINIAKLVAPVDSPELADFVANLDRINALADDSPGFVWRFKTEDGAIVAQPPFDDDIVINMTVWEDMDSMHHFVYKTAHVEIMRRRKEWFKRMEEVFMVLWWVPQGHQPTPAEAHARLQLLHEKGPSPEAFTFKNPFDAPDRSNRNSRDTYNESCPSI